MPAVAWVTVIIAVLIIAVTAVGLLRVVLHLAHVNKTLAALLGGVRAVADKTHHRAHRRRLGERQPGARASVDGDGVMVPYGWTLGLVIGLVVVVAVVALVTPILVLAYKIGTQARRAGRGAVAGAGEHRGPRRAEHHHRPRHRDHRRPAARPRAVGGLTCCTDAEITYWTVILVLGAVVIVAVVVLLSLLVAFVKRIGAGVNAIAGTLTADHREHRRHHADHGHRRRARARARRRPAAPPVPRSRRREGVRPMLVVLTVVEIVVLIAGLAFFLWWVGSLLTKIATTLEAGDGLVAEIVDDARAITPGLEHINRTGGVVAGALPLLYGFAEQIVAKVTPRPGPRGRRGPPPLPDPRDGGLPPLIPCVGAPAGWVIVRHDGLRVPLLPRADPSRRRCSRRSSAPRQAGFDAAMSSDHFSPWSSRQGQSGVRLVLARGGAAGDGAAVRRGQRARASATTRRSSRRPSAPSARCTRAGSGRRWAPARRATSTSPATAGRARTSAPPGCASAST